MDAYGVDVNFSCVRGEDGDWDFGCHITGSDGTDVNAEVKSDSFYDGITALYTDLVNEVSQTQSKKELDSNHQYDAVCDELDEAYEELAILQNKIDELEIQAANLEERLEEQNDAENYYNCMSEELKRYADTIKKLNSFYSKGFPF